MNSRNSRGYRGESSKEASGGSWLLGVRRQLNQQRCTSFREKFGRIHTSTMLLEELSLAQGKLSRSPIILGPVL